MWGHDLFGGIEAQSVEIYQKTLSTFSLERSPNQAGMRLKKFLSRWNFLPFFPVKSNVKKYALFTKQFHIFPGIVSCPKKYLFLIYN